MHCEQNGVKEWPFGSLWGTDDPLPQVAVHWLREINAGAAETDSCPSILANGELVSFLFGCRLVRALPAPAKRTCCDAFNSPEYCCSLTITLRFVPQEVWLSRRPTPTLGYVAFPLVSPIQNRRKRIS